MSGTRARNVTVAVIGLLAVVGMLFPLSTLLAMVPTGEVAVLRVVPTVLGTLLLLIASLVLLFRRPEHGWTFAVATIALLVGMAWLHATLSPWHGFAVVAAAAGAVIGFRKERGDEAAE